MNKFVKFEPYEADDLLKVTSFNIFPIALQFS